MSYSDWLHVQWLSLLNGTDCPCHVCQSGACDTCNVFDKE